MRDSNPFQEVLTEVKPLFNYKQGISRGKIVRSTYEVLGHILFEHKQR